MKVCFHMVSEFIGEIEEDIDLVEDKILRVTRTYQETNSAPLVHLYTVATCVVRGKIVELRQYCGQMFPPHTGVDQKPTSQERLTARLEETLKQEAARLGLTLRAGILED